MDALGLAQSGLSFVMELGHGGLLTSSDSNMQVPPVKLWPAKEGSGTWIRVHRAELKSLCGKQPRSQLEQKCCIPSWGKRTNGSRQ